MSVFHRIRESTAYVAENARWINIDETALLMYPEKLLSDESQTKIEHTTQHHYLGHGDDTIRFFVLLDTINFGSGYFPYLAKNVGSSGYYTIAERLSKYIYNNGVPTPEILSSISPKHCSEIFEQDLNNKHSEELMILFSIAWQQLGRWTLERHNGDYINFLKSSSTAEEAINEIIQMPFYKDYTNYLETQVWFLKRAQILIQDIKIAEPNHELIQYPDINFLTVFADNVLPFVFRLEGITQYDPWLEARIENGEIIGSSSTEEIEIRACSVAIGERLTEIIREEMRPITVRELDYLLWLRGQKLKKMSSLKRHRCRCVYY